MRKLLLIVLLSLILGSVVAAQDDMQQVAQWARRASASSEYTSSRWSADQATGEPDTDACADDENAWASLDVTDNEYLVLEFREEVIPTQINIYQNYNPGAIVAVAIVPANGDDPILIDNSADPSDECPSVFSLNLPDGLPETNSVAIFLDQSLIGDWNEIDAVELVGLVEGDPDDSDESSLESGDFPQFEVFSARGRIPSGNDNSGGPSTRNNTSNSNNSNNSSPDYDVDWGVNMTCRGGGGIVDGTGITIIQQRAGNQYTVTAIGIDGFDPVLGVSLSDNLGNALCNDDERSANYYNANLPSTGQVNGSNLTSQVVFNLNSNNNFENVAIAVGSADGRSGEFILLVEGMYASDADGVGDPFSLYVSPSLYESGVTPTAYMISVTNGLDALLFLIDADYNYIEDSSGNIIGCDDAGNSSLCWGENSSMARSFISRTQNRTLGGGSLDAMLTVPIDQESVGFYQNYVMSGNNSFGDYVSVFHLGWAGQ